MLQNASSNDENCFLTADSIFSQLGINKKFQNIVTYCEGTKQKQQKGLKISQRIFITKRRFVF